MKTCGKHKVNAQIAGPGLVLAALFAVMLSAVSIGRAQSGAVSPTTPGAKPAAAPAKAPALPAVKPPVKVQSEGIKIHGHWIIEVRNPNGSIASHTEFENSYIFGSYFPNILSRIQTLGEWGIVLGGSSSPCVASVSTPFSAIEGVEGEAVPPPACVITETGPAIGANIYGSSPTSPCNPSAGTGSCANNLQVSADPNTGNPTLTGNVVATNSGTISQVETIFSACGPALSSTACATETAADFPTLDSVSAFTATPLPAPGSGMCGGAGQPPCAVPVIAQQTIQVSVQFSFQ
jgi:hypothetical protein